MSKPGPPKIQGEVPQSEEKVSTKVKSMITRGISLRAEKCVASDAKLMLDRYIAPIFHVDATMAVSQGTVFACAQSLLPL